MSGIETEQTGFLAGLILLDFTNYKKGNTMIEAFVNGFIITIGALMWFAFVGLIELYVAIASWFA